MALMSALGLIWIWVPKIWHKIRHPERETYEQRFKREKNENKEYSEDLDGYFD